MNQKFFYSKSQHFAFDTNLIRCVHWRWDIRFSAEKQTSYELVLGVCYSQNAEAILNADEAVGLLKMIDLDITPPPKPEWPKPNG